MKLNCMYFPIATFLKKKKRKKKLRMLSDKHTHIAFSLLKLTHLVMARVGTMTLRVLPIGARWALLSIFGFVTSVFVLKKKKTKHRTCCQVIEKNKHLRESG